MGYLKLCGIVLHLATLAILSSAQDMCGMPQPDPTKTCISIRLPWNPQPMYFCTDKSKFRYRNQCQNRFSTSCGVDSVRQDTLMVASPWDCCPMVSYPDSCVNQQCPAPPHERKCQVMEPNPNTPWECCNSYFCEENVTPETCHFKRLEPTCNMPPQGKTNCVAFVDPFGCCPKFQCDGDARPGQCPAEAEAMKFMARFNATNANMMMMMGPGGPMMMPPVGMGPANNAMAPGAQAEMQQVAPAAEAPAPAERDQISPNAESLSVKPAGPMLSKIAAGGFIMPGHNQNTIACIGDANCPGTMKCCSNDMNVYVKDGVYMFRNRNPTYGYCTEPAAAATAPMMKRNGI